MKESSTGRCFTKNAFLPKIPEQRFVFSRPVVLQTTTLLKTEIIQNKILFRSWSLLASAAPKNYLTKRILEDAFTIERTTAKFHIKSNSIKQVTTFSNNFIFRHFR